MALLYLDTFQAFLTHALEKMCPVHSSCKACDTDFCVKIVRLILLHSVTFKSVTDLRFMSISSLLKSYSLAFGYVISKGYCSIPVYQNLTILLADFLCVAFDRSGKFLLLSSL